MTNKETIIWLEGMKEGVFPWSDEVMNEVCDTAISALSENKGDLISREKLKDYLDRNISFGGVEKKFAFFDIIDSITSAENKGEWIYDGDCIHCSSCKSAFNNLIGFNFCPNCGADMREVSE